MNADSHHDDDDIKLFRESIGQINRLKSQRPVQQVRPNPIPKKSREDEKGVIDSLLDHPPADPDIEAGDELAFLRPGLQRNILRKLRRGDYRVEGEIDLHGLIVSEAKQALFEFLEDSLHHGRRCIRVIHGKGLRSFGGRPILKIKTDHWLRRNGSVLAYSSAPSHDGGTGAIYVLLKREG
jgi:DNA-nicking Smr family endonuclease